MPSRTRARPASTTVARHLAASVIWRWPLLLLALVFALKTALALTLAGHPLLQPVGELDAGEYWRLAQRVADGDVLLQGTPFYVSPLYIYWLAFARAVTGGSVSGVLVLQAVLGTVAVWLVGRVAAYWTGWGAMGAKVAAGRPSPRSDVSDRRSLIAAIVAGGALTSTGIIALQEALILQSALDSLLMALLALSFTRAMMPDAEERIGQARLLRQGSGGLAGEAPRPSASHTRWLWCGATLALLATNRPNAWLLAPVCLPAALLRPATAPGRLRAASAWLVGIAIVLAPFTLRTAIATGDWQVLPGHGGLNLYIGNHAGATGTYTVIDGIRPSIDGQREDMRRVAGQSEGRTLTDAEASTYFTRASLAWWRVAPSQAIGLFAYKAWLAIHSWELPVNVSYTWFREQTWLLKLLPLGAWLLVPLGLAGSVAGHLAVDPSRRDAWRWFRWLLPVYLLSVAFFFVVDRYRAPALVLGAIHIGVLASMRPSQAPAWKDTLAVGAVGVGLAAFVAGLVPLPFHLGQGDADTRMALHAIEHGRDDEARAWLDRAAARHPAPGVAWFRAGLAWQSRNDPSRAELALREAHRIDPDVADVSFALAGVLLAQGKGSDAVPLLEQVERAGARPDRARLDLALALWQAGDEQQARAVLARGVPSSGLDLLRARALASVEARRLDLAEWLLAEHRRHVANDAEVAEKLGLMKARRGDLAQAVALLEDAARLDQGRATARFNLAIIRVQQGRRGDAIALLREALSIDPNYAQAAGALRELQSR